METKNKQKKGKNSNCPPILGFKLIMIILRPLFKIAFNPKIYGKENIPEDGAIIIAGNHYNFFDQCMPIGATRRPINFMAKSEYFEGKAAPLFRFAGCIPVNRDGKDFRAMRMALSVLKKGGAIGIFPEGTRNRTEDFLLPFKPGTTAMAKKTGAPIIPFGIGGDYKLRSKNLVITIGEPFYVDDMSLEEANERLRNEVARLKTQSIETGKNIK